MNQHHNPTLDGVRDLAILAVVIFHTMSWYPYFGMGRNVIRAISLGWMGVDLFFVLSGFLITRILLETRQASNRVKSFYARRALRIFPVYYLVLVSIWILAVCHPGTSFLFAGRAWSNRLAYAAYVQNWLVPFNVKYVSWNIIGHFWSLAIEEQFYLIWPWVVWKAGVRWTLRLSVLGVIGALLSRVLLVSYWEMSRGSTTSP